MSGIVTVREDLGIVEIRTQGDISIQDMIQTRESVVGICQEHKIYKVLIYALDWSSRPDTFQLFQFGREMSESVILRKIKFAVLASKATAEDIQFIKTVALNRNGADIQVFDSLDAALAWLNP